MENSVAMKSAESLPREAPWDAGLRALRANLVPGLILQSFMALLLIGYWYNPQVHDWISSLGKVKIRWGLGYTVAASIFAAAVLPELMRWLVIQHGRWRTENIREFLFAVPFWGGMGICVDYFYYWQAQWFGDRPVFVDVAPQVIVDLFVYNPLFSTPMIVSIYAWKDRGFRWQREFFTLPWYRDQVIPALVATWGVWLPVVIVIYSMPSDVRVVVWAFALAFWVLLYSWMSAEYVEKERKG